MTNDDEGKIDEQALRAQFERALEQHGVPEGAAEPRPAAERRERRSDEDPHLHRGTVTGIDGRDVLVELGPRAAGVISIEEFEEPPAIGSEWEFSLVSIRDGVWTLTRREARALATWRDLEPGREVRARVIGFNSGGLELKIGPVAAFLPASEVDLRRVEDLESRVGETMVCEVLQVDRRRKRVVLSRRAVLERERREERERTLQSLAVGEVVRGTVERVEPFGAFVHLGGGVTGLLHVSNLSHRRVADAREVLEPGAALEVQVLEIQDGGRRIALGRKQLEPDPWDGVAERFPPGAQLQGKVMRLVDYGAFVELEEGVEGLLHRSRLGVERQKRVEDVLSVGEEIVVRVVEVDVEQRRIALSRQSEHGAVLGSDEEGASREDVEAYDRRRPDRPFGTRLGDLLREALEKRRLDGGEE